MDDLQVYRWMLVSRELDARLCELNPRWFPSLGEEATIVGSFCDLRPDDVAAPHYRDPFAVYLMRGAEMWRLAAQVLGKAAGYNAGRSVPFNGPVDRNVVPWVAGDLGTTLGVATGAALAAQQEGSDRVCVCTFGDGTANRGDFFENVNLAACWRLPIVYLCQNNAWAISQPVNSYLPASVAARAPGFAIPGATLDGNDVDAVRRAVGDAIARARAGEGPSLLDARTWRVAGHWAGDDNSYRGESTVPVPPDPLARYEARLRERALIDAAGLERFRSEVRAEVDEAIRRAQAEPDAGAVQVGPEEVYA